MLLDFQNVFSLSLSLSGSFFFVCVRRNRFSSCLLFPTVKLLNQLGTPIAYSRPDIFSLSLSYRPLRDSPHTRARTNSVRKKCLIITFVDGLTFGSIALLQRPLPPYHVPAAATLPSC